MAAARVKFKSAVEIIKEHKEKASKKKPRKVYFIQCKYKDKVYEDILFADPYFSSKMPCNNEWRRLRGYANLHSLRQAVDCLKDKDKGYLVTYYDFRIEAYGGYSDLTIASKR